MSNIRVSTKSGDLNRLFVLTEVAFESRFTNALIEKKLIKLVQRAMSRDTKKYLKRSLLADAYLSDQVFAGYKL